MAGESQWGRIHEYSLGYKKPKFIDYPPANYTPPGKPSFVDIFKGKDDEDYPFKTYLLTKHSALVAGGLSAMDIVVGTQPKDVIGALRRIMYWSLPLVGGGIAYTSIVCVAGSIRKKNDRTNHAIGGIAAGTVFGAARRSIMFGVVTGAFAVVAGFLYKDSVLHNWEMCPQQRKPRIGFSLSHKADFTLAKNIPGNWTKEPPQ